MARIPDLQPRGSVIGNISTPRPDRSGQIISQAVSDIGVTVFNTGVETATRNARFNYTIAESQFLTADIESRKAVQEDGDNYENWEQTHQENLQKALDASMARIISPRDRAIFEAQAKADMARSIATVQSAANGRRVDVARADLKSGLQAILVQSTDPNTTAADRQRLVEVVHDMIASARDADLPLVTAEEAEAMQKDWVNQYATQSVGLMSDEDQMHILKNPKGTQAQYLSPAQRDDMYRSAERRSKVDRVNAAAIENTDRIIRKYDTLAGRKAALEEVSRIDDPAVQLATRNMIHGRYAEIKAIKDEEINLAAEEVEKLIESNKEDIELIRQTNEWKALPASDQARLEGRWRQRKSGVEPVQDWEAQAEWDAMSPEEKLETNVYLKFRSRLDDQHYDAIRREQTVRRDAKEGDEASQGVVRDGQTQSQMITTTLVANGFNKPKASDKLGQRRWAQFNSEVDRRVKMSAEEKGKRLSSAELQQVVDDVFMEQVFVNKNWFAEDPSKPISMLSDDEVLRAYVPKDQIPQEGLEGLQNIAKSEGLKVSDDQYERAYAAMLRGDFDLMLKILRGRW